ncbi:hypothetical protein NFI96_031688, partial [Prochilodus magdalenae]
MFYRGTVESILRSCIIACFGNCNASDSKTLQRIVRTAEKIIGVYLPSVTDIHTTHCTRKVISIVKDPTHPSHGLFSLLPSGRSATLRRSVLLMMHFCVSVKTSDTEELQVQTVKYGENVTVKCDHNFVKDSRQHYLAWYKQSFGKQPQFIVRSTESKADIRYARAFAEHFRVTADEGKFDLSIINTVDEDTGTYFCVKLKDYVAEFGSGTLLLFTDERSQQSDVTEVDVKRGESVTLQCSVARLSCSGEHSVYWYRHGSGEPHPGIIYTHGNTNSPCTRSSETDSSTQSCVYKLPKRNISLSDAGTYYCAVAACGQILFGDGTKLDVKGENIWIVPVLTTTNVISVIVIVVLAVLLLKNQRKGWSPVLMVGNTDALNYAALKFNKKPPHSRTPRVKE